MLNTDSVSVQSAPEAGRKNVLERVFTSAVQLLLSKSTGAKAKSKLRRNGPGSFLSPVRKPSSLSPKEYTRYDTLSPPSPPRSPPTEHRAQGALESDYAADPIFTALDANDLPDLTLSIAAEIDSLWGLARKNLCATAEDAPKHSDSDGIGDEKQSAKVPKANIPFTRRSQRKPNPFNTHDVAPVTPPKDTLSHENSVTASAASTPPQTPAWSNCSTKSSNRQCASSLSRSSSAAFLSTPSSPPSPNHPDLQPRQTQLCPLRKLPNRQTRAFEDAPLQNKVLGIEEQRKAEDRLRKAADFENRIRAIEQEEDLKQRGSRRGLGTKRRGSLSISLFSTSPSTCARALSKSLRSSPPVTISLEPPAPQPLSPALPLSLSITPDTSVASNGTRSSIASSLLLPGIVTLGVRRESNCTEHDEGSIMKIKGNVLERNEDATTAEVELPNVLSSPTSRRFLTNSSPDDVETTPTPAFNKSDDALSKSDRPPISPFTISACGRSPPSTADTRGQSSSFAPNSQVTPPPTPPCSVQQASPRLQKKHRPAASEPYNVPFNGVTLNGNCSKNALSADGFDTVRLRASYYKKIESNGTLKLTLTPNLVRGIDGDVGRVWRGQHSDENYDSDDRGNESGDEVDGKKRGASWNDDAPSYRDQEGCALTRNVVERG